MHVWSVGGPFCFDDLHLVLAAERYLAGESSDAALFRFAATADDWQALRDAGNYPWWSPADGRADFFRPLSEAAFYLDMKLFGRAAAGHRAMSLVVFVAALAALNRLFRVTGADRLRAGLATMMFGVSQTAAQPATFVSNRGDLFVLIGLCAAAGAYWRCVAAPPADRVGSVWPRLVWAAGGFAFALLSKEVALGWAGTLVLFEAWRRMRRDRAARPAATAALLAITAALCMAHIAYYAVTRGGAAGDRAALLTAAPKAVVFYLAVWLLGAPINLLTDRGLDTILPLAAGCTVTIALLAPHLRRLLAADPAARFFVCWAAAFGAMALFTQPEARALCLATPGWAYLLAHFLLPRDAAHESAGAATDISRRPSSSPLPPAAAPSLMLRHHLLFANGGIGMAAAVGIVVFSMQAERQARTHIESALTSLDAPLRDGDTLIIRRPESDLEWLAAGDRLAFLTGRRDAALCFLHAADAESTLTPEGNRTLHVSLDAAATDRAWSQRSSMLHLALPPPSLLDARLARRMNGSAWSATPGEQFSLRDFAVEIAAADGQQVQALTFRFNLPMDDPRLRWAGGVPDMGH